MNVAVIIPTYNERENIQVIIPKILEEFREGAIEGGIIVVDDASPDGTSEVVEEFAKNSNRVYLFRRQGKLGIGSAYKDGFKFALSREFDGVIEMDADLSHNPSYLPDFVGGLEKGLELIIGSRYIPGGEIPKWSFSRRMISSLTNKVARFLLSLEPMDVTSGYRAYSSNVFRKLDLSQVKSDGYAFQVEMVMRCQRLGFKIGEIPIAFVDREKGETKLDRREMWQFLKSIIKLAFS